MLSFFWQTKLAKVKTAEDWAKKKKNRKEKRNKKSKIRLIAYAFVLVRSVSIKCWVSLLSIDMEYAVIYLGHHKIDLSHDTSTVYMKPRRFNSDVFSMFIEFPSVHKQSHWIYMLRHFFSVLFGVWLLFICIFFRPRKIFVHKIHHLSTNACGRNASLLTHSFDRISNNWKSERPMFYYRNLCIFNWWQRAEIISMECQNKMVHAPIVFIVFVDIVLVMCGV